MANQALNNLKTIHNMQKEGSLLELLRDLRALKSQLDEKSKELLNSKKERIAKKEAEAIKIKIAEEPKEEKEVSPSYISNLQRTDRFTFD